MPNNVNLDALIPREDFQVIAPSDGSQGGKIQSFHITNLERHDFFYNVLRKPDFQRETSSWSPEKICDLVTTFLADELIPAIILWRQGKDIFVIDGAHRLSALVAWVHDDYGDGEASRQFYQNDIPPEQKKAALKTKALIDSKIGSYVEHKKAVTFPANSKPEVLLRANKLGSLAVQLQWVEGNAQKAEASFFKINQSATLIDKTELRILQSRERPNAIASRVIIHNASGHKYWEFENDNQEKIEKLGKEIYANLFMPPLHTPIKTLDIPIAGRGYSAQSLPLLFESINLANDLKIIDSPKGKTTAPSVDPPEDKDGTSTIEFLKNVRRVAYRISGTTASSLGLHPAVYFYSAEGRYQPTAFLAVVSLIKDLEKTNSFVEFTDRRYVFEEFLLNHKYLVNDVTIKWGSAVKGFSRLKDLYTLILKYIADGKSEDEILGALRQHETFSQLSSVSLVPRTKNTKRKDFSDEVKSETFLNKALENPIRCSLCKCLMHSSSITTDHIQDKRNLGTGSSDNAQLAHPYCNSTYKDIKAKRAVKG